MRRFPLAVEGEVRSFDTDGRVLDTADNVVGSWTTTDDNRVRVDKSDGGHVDLAVDWKFNASNQLTLSIGGRELFAIVNTTDGLPRYSLDNNVLVVDPDGDGDFEFRLRCLFGINEQGNLVVSINGTESVIDGFIEDKKSRFRFQFFDKQLPSFPNSLVLSGQWERKPVADEIRLHFKLDDPALEIAAKPLDLPAAVRVDPARNHLALVYQSASHGERRVQFLGSFEIRPGWTLVFRIDDVKDGGVRKSKIEVETTFEWDAARGSLSLFVGKTRTPTSQVVEVGGALSVVLKNNATLDWTFAYQKNTAGGKAVTTIATALQFKFDQNQLLIEYKQDGKSRSVNITAKVVKEDFTLTGGVQIVNDPQGRRVKSFIGVSF
jgi:hypothetical protein